MRLRTLFGIAALSTAVGLTVGSGAASAAPDGSAGARTATACQASSLTTTVVRGDSGAGQRDATIVQKNTSDGPCTITGYGTLRLSDGSTDLPTRQVRETDSPPDTVTLGPGKYAQSQVRWTVNPAPGEPGGQCQPDPAFLDVAAPDSEHANRVTWRLGAVCAGGKFVQRPYVHAA